MFWPTMKTFGARLVRLSDAKHRFWTERPTSMHDVPGGGTRALPARPRPPTDRRTV
jgi:hypothetical protein